MHNQYSPYLVIGVTLLVFAFFGWLNQRNAKKAKAERAQRRATMTPAEVDADIALEAYERVEEQSQLADW